MSPYYASILVWAAACGVSIWLSAKGSGNAAAAMAIGSFVGWMAFNLWSAT